MSSVPVEQMNQTALIAFVKFTRIQHQQESIRSAVTRLKLLKQLSFQSQRLSSKNCLSITRAFALQVCYIILYIQYFTNVLCEIIYHYMVVLDSVTHIHST